MEVETDAELCGRCRAGEEDAWDALMHRYSEIVFNIARRNGLSDFDAGDVVQEVFIALLKNIGKLRKEERLLAWIVSTTRRAAWKNKRQRNIAAGHEQAAAQDREPTAAPPPEEMQALEDMHIVRLAYGQIGERCRRLLDMLFLDADAPGYTEISKRLGMPIGSIGPTRGRCLETLRTALRAVGFAPDGGLEPA